MNKIKDALHNLQMTKTDKIYYIISWIMFFLELSWNCYYYIFFCNNDLEGLLTYNSALFSVLILPIIYVFVNLFLINKNKVNKWSLIFLFVLRVISPGTILLFYSAIFQVCVKYF